MFLLTVVKEKGLKQNCRPKKKNGHKKNRKATKRLDEYSPGAKAVVGLRVSRHIKFIIINRSLSVTLLFL